MIDHRRMIIVLWCNTHFISIKPFLEVFKLTIENAKDLKAKIKHYLKAGDFETAKKFAYQYQKMEGFNIDEALEEIRKAETGTKKR